MDPVPNPAPILVPEHSHIHVPATTPSPAPATAHAAIPATDTATSNASEYMDTVLHQNWTFYKIQIYALSSLWGRVENKQGRIIIQTCTEPYCNFESFLF